MIRKIKNCNKSGVALAAGEGSTTYSQVGIWPHTVERLETDFQEVSIEDTRLLLGLNAIECYDLDVEGLTEIARKVGPTPNQLNQDPNLRTPDNAIREARWWFDDYGMEWKG